MSTAGRAAVVSEEAPADWLGRGRRLDLAGHVCWFRRPFAGKPRPPEWHALLARLAELRAQRGVDLAVIDPLAHFLPGRDENHAGLMLEALLPLQQLTAAGLAVLVLHHPRKADAPDGLAARGSTALAGYADVVLELRWYTRGTDRDRRRRLLAWSRDEATPPQQVIELTADGTDYVSRGDFEAESYDHNWVALRGVLERASAALTLKAILAEWPPAEAAPGAVALWRWLERAAADGRLLRRGAGRRNDPYRYWLPGTEEAMEQRRWELPPLQ